VQNAVEETYRDVEMLIHSICHNFVRQKGISERWYEDWHAEACLAFVCACSNFDRTRGCFSTWLWHSVWNALSDKLRLEAAHYLTPHLKERQMLGIVDGRSLRSNRIGFDPSVLSQDARAVVMLVFDTFGHVDARQAKPEEIRLSIYSLLTDLGWSFRRVVESFHEIQIALTE